MRLFKWAALTAVAVLIGWRASLLGAELMAETPHVTTADSALRQAFELRDEDPIAARELLRSAVWQRPTDGRPYVLMATLIEQSRSLRAASLVQRGERLAPQQLETRLAAGAFWLRQNQPASALTSWDAALRAHPALGETLFPVLARLAETQKGQAALSAMVAQSPPWWSDFFDYFALNAPDINAVHALYRGTETTADGSLAAAARRAYLQRLEQDQRWLDAYFVWLNGISLRHLNQFGNLHNGEFELPLSNMGFGWRYQTSPNITIETAFAGDDSGDKALSINLNPTALTNAGGGESSTTIQLSQYLLLPPGDYQLRGVARANRLPDDANIHWVLRCLDQPQATPIARSRTFAGTLRWQQFRVNFTLPESNSTCLTQKLELIQSRWVAGGGELWFDGLAIKRRTDGRGGSLGRQ